MKYIKTFESLFSKILFKDEKRVIEIIKNFNKLIDVRVEKPGRNLVSSPHFYFLYNDIEYRCYSKGSLLIMDNSDIVLEFKHQTGAFINLDISKSSSRKLFNMLIDLFGGAYNIISNH